jgi:hypothetical protein
LDRAALSSDLALKASKLVVRGSLAQTVPARYTPARGAAARVGLPVVKALSARDLRRSFNVNLLAASDIPTW